MQISNLNKAVIDKFALLLDLYKGISYCVTAY